MSNKTNTEFPFFVGAAVVAVALIMSVNALMCGLLQGPSADMSDEAIAVRIAPVAQLNTGAAIESEAPAVVATAAASGGSRSGEDVYTAQCAMCHATGAAGAPKIGDVGAWGARIATGMDVLMNSAINGKAAMPARGLCATCSDDELQAAVEHMVNNSK